VTRWLLALALQLAAAPAAKASHAGHPLPPPSQVAPHQCVVVLHGMARTRFYMRLIEQDLEKAGYTVVNESFPTRKETIEQLAQRVDGLVQQCRDTGATRIHFVTHSLGGLVVRYWLSGHALPEAGRFLMLGTPNRGSEVADHYMHSRWYRLTTGPAGLQIGTAPDSLPNRLGPPPMETAVIAGSRSASPALSRLFGGPNDGKVSVASTPVPGMVDFLVVDNSHYFLTRSSEVLRQMRAFLATGRFEH
jgi:alpha-beta hydrolase superfamily lysophospholipase